MDIHISKESEVPIQDQLAAQIVFMIGTGQLKPGEALPSVRELARRLEIHRNTVSQAYRDSTLNLLVVKRPGSRLVVRAREPEELPGAGDLESLVDSAVRTARGRGYTLRQLHERLRARLLTAPPDRILVLSADSGMRVLLRMELKQRFDCPVEACAPDEPASNRELLVGALVVTPPGHLPEIEPLLPAERPAVPITYSSADKHVELIRQLDKPSLVAIISISEYFLKMARRVLAPVVGRRHSIRDYLLRRNTLDTPGAADLIFCDSIAYRVVLPRYHRARVVPHQLISPACLDQISSILSGGPAERP